MTIFWQSLFILQRTWASILENRATEANQSQDTLKMYWRCCLSQLEFTTIQLASLRFQRTLRTTPGHSSRQHLECTSRLHNMMLQQDKSHVCKPNERLQHHIPGEVTDLQHLHIFISLGIQAATLAYIRDKSASPGYLLKFSPGLWNPFNERENVKAYKYTY